MRLELEDEAHAESTSHDTQTTTEVTEADSLQAVQLHDCERSIFLVICRCVLLFFVLGQPWREVMDVWCLTPVLNLKAVIWFLWFIFTDNIFVVKPTNLSGFMDLYPQPPTLLFAYLFGHKSTKICPPPS